MVGVVKFIEERRVLGQHARIDFDPAQPLRRKRLTQAFAQQAQRVKLGAAVDCPVQHQPLRIDRIKGDPAVGA